MSILDEIKEAIIAGNQSKTTELAQQAVDEGQGLDSIIQDGFIAAMSIVGDRFKRNEIYVPEMLIAARAMKAGLEVVKPLLVGGEVETLAKVVLGTVKGDLHDIGKNLVAMLLEGAGAEVIDIGVDVAPEQFVESVRAHQPQFVGMSALLTTTMPSMKETIDTLEKAGLRDDVKILVGGAPVTQKYADEIGADGYGANASEAVDRIKELSQ